MAEETGSLEPVIVSAPVGESDAFSLSDAVNAYTGAVTELEKPKKPEKSPAESAEPATAEPELSDEDNAGPEKAPGETEEADPEAEKLPPIERPRSWSKDADDDWNALPRTRQEKIAANEQAREADATRRINEAADARKAAEAERVQAEQARQQYETKTKAALEVLEREQLRDFADIKSMADVEKMAMEDPFRKIQWDVHQDKIRAAAWESQQADQRKAQAHQTEWATHVQTEDAKAAELIPELADKVKGPALRQKAVDRLSELGFKPEELNELASGKTKLSIYDHRIQQLIFSHLKLRDIQAAPKAIVTPDLPPVQRPGTQRAPGSANSERLNALIRKSSEPGGLDLNAATELYQLQSSRRAS